MHIMLRGLNKFIIVVYNSLNPCCITFFYILIKFSSKILTSKSDGLVIRRKHGFHPIIYGSRIRRSFFMPSIIIKRSLCIVDLLLKDLKFFGISFSLFITLNRHRGRFGIISLLCFIIRYSVFKRIRGHKLAVDIIYLSKHDIVQILSIIKLVALINRL